MGSGVIVTNQHEDQDGWSKESNFRVGDEVGGHWQQMSIQLAQCRKGILLR